MTARTLRSLDSDLRCACVTSTGATGYECRRFTAGRDIEGEAIGGDAGIEPGIDVRDGGEDAGDAVTSPQDADPSGKNPPVVVHELFPEVVPSLSSSGVDDVIGLGVADGALAMTESGGKMLKILSSAVCGPYESNGSGTACSMGSITGSDLLYKISDEEVEDGI